MPGRRLETTVNFEEEMQIVNSRIEFFIADVKGNIQEDFLAQAIKFPPIIMNINLITNEATISSTMYNFMKNEKIGVDKKEHKLTQLTDTNGDLQANE
jgi:hypothetical protein